MLYTNYVRNISALPYVMRLSNTVKPPRPIIVLAQLGETKWLKVDLYTKPSVKVVRLRKTRRRCLEGRDIPSMQVLTIEVFEVCDQPLYDGSDTSTPFSSIFHLNLSLDVVHKPFLLMLKPSTVFYVERGYGACFC